MYADNEYNNCLDIEHGIGINGIITGIIFWLGKSTNMIDLKSLHISLAWALINKITISYIIELFMENANSKLIWNYILKIAIFPIASATIDPKKGMWYWARCSGL